MASPWKIDPKSVRVLPLYEQVLEEANDTVAAWNGELVFVFLPVRTRYVTDDYPESGMHRLDVLGFAEKLGIRLVDAHSVFQDHGDPLGLFPFRNAPGHYTAEGYRLIAEAVRDELAR